jgi:hypothetical protein
MKAAESSVGKRLIDVMDVHWYPEATGDNIRITSDGDTQGLSNARIQAPRSLWDSTYVENSWIANSLGNKAISLLPLLSGKIRAHYPGTKLSITEYNYGGSNAISGAIAQADVLGLFGRNGVYAAANWGLYGGAKAQLAGFKSFINYDRAGSKFGDQGLFVTGEVAAENSVYASASSSIAGRFTVVVINKTVGTTPFKIHLSGYTIRAAKIYTVVDGQYDTPAYSSTNPVSDTFKFDAPPQSISTIMVTAAIRKTFYGG